MTIQKKTQLSLIAITILLASAIWLYTDSANSQSSRLLLTSYATNANRTQTVSTFCSGKDRNNLIDQSSQSATAFYSAQMAKQFPIDGNSLIVSVLNGNYSAAVTTAKSSTSSLVTFIGIFFVGLVILLLVSPFLICCCCCPSCCPSKCCQKSQSQQYTKCELYWPAITLIVALLICIGACIAGFTQSKQVAGGITNVACAGAIVVDDFLNGNVTTDGTSWFVGLNSLTSQLGVLITNLTAINTTFQSIQTSNSNISAATNAATTALNNIQLIPLNSPTNTGNAALSYNTPLNSNAPSSTISSNFPSVLGSTANGGLVGAAYTAVTATKTAITSIASAATVFVNQPNFASTLTSTQTTVSNFATTITNFDSTVSSSLKTANSADGQLTLGIQLFYGITIAFSIIMLLGALLVTFCEKYTCRYLIYFACVVLFFIGLIGFLLSFLFSIGAPLVYFGCQFMTYSLTNASTFSNNFASLTDTNTISYVTTCLPTSSGNIFNAIGGNSVSAINNFTTAIQDFSNFNAVNFTNTINQAMTNMSSLVTQYQTAQIADITDTASLNMLTQISNPSNYASCSATGFTSDSWVPSDSQVTSYVSCNINNGNNATATQCTTANLRARTGNCLGCMDTYSVLSAYSSSATLSTDLTTRYSGGTCTTFISDLTNIWSNFYNVKKTVIGPIATRVTTAQTSVTNLNTNLTNIATVFQQAATNLTNLAASVTDPTYGMIAGLNCRVFGEDVVRFKNTFCSSVFSILYFSRLVIGIGSFGILFALCCGVCTGVRHYKHSLRKQNTVSPFGEDDANQATNVNFVKPKTLE